MVQLYNPQETGFKGGMLLCVPSVDWEFLVILPANPFLVDVFSWDTLESHAACSHHRVHCSRHCIGYFSVAVIRHYNQKWLMVEFLLSYGSRGLESIMGGGVGEHGMTVGTGSLLIAVSLPHRKQRKQEVGGEAIKRPQSHFQWCTFSSETPLITTPLTGDQFNTWTHEGHFLQKLHPPPMTNGATGKCSFRTVCSSVTGSYVGFPSTAVSFSTVSWGHRNSPAPPALASGRMVGN